MPLLDLARDACEHILSFADPFDRHALRATCTDMYGLRAVGAVRVPVSSETALELCRKRREAQEEGRLPRVPFWGSTAEQLILVALRPCGLECVAGFSSALGVVVKGCPKTVELVAVAGAVGKHFDAQRALECLASSPRWAPAWLYLRLGQRSGAVLVADTCSAELRTRLAWCDAPITASRAFVVNAPFAVLQNLQISTNPRCLAYLQPIGQAFPAVQHVNAWVDKGGDQIGALITNLAPAGHKLLSLSLNSWQTHKVVSPCEPLALSGLTAYSGTGMMPLTTGGCVSSDIVSGGTKDAARAFGATELLTIAMDQDLAAAILAGHTRVRGMLALCYNPAVRQACPWLS